PSPGRPAQGGPRPGGRRGPGSKHPPRGAVDGQRADVPRLPGGPGPRRRTVRASRRGAVPVHGARRRLHAGDGDRPGRCPRSCCCPQRGRPATTGGGAMRLRLVILAAICAAALTVPAAARADTGPAYYVALGDSIATGAQPARSGELNGLHAANGTNRGYVDDLYAAKRATMPNLQLRNFGCGGETTQTMITGGTFSDTRCGYKTSPQLDQAAAFLEAHRGQIAFITIDIGANPLTHPAPTPPITPHPTTIPHH